MNSETAYMAINVAKQRNGRTGMVNLIFDPRMMRYAEISRMEEQRA
jgi:replicative DNA helicase